MKSPRAFRRLLATAAATVSAIASLAACTPAALLNGLVPSEGYGVVKDVAYGGDDRQRLDLYVPEEIASPAPILVFFYGGSWKSGERSYYRFVGEAFAARGYLVVIPDYRLYPAARFPVFVEDGAQALKWVARNATSFGGDPDRIILAGHSAGAHLAALLLFDQRYLSAVAFERQRILGLVGLAGPYAFNPLAYGGTRSVFATVDYPDQARPIAFVDGSEPPVLLMHGEKDSTVELVNAYKLARRIREAGGEARVLTYPQRTHIGLILSLAAPFRGRDSVHADMLIFMDQLSSHPARLDAAAAEG